MQHGLRLIAWLVFLGASLLACHRQTKYGTLSEAVVAGDVADTKLHLAAGADPNKPNGAGTTPLHQAVVYGNPELVQLLLDHKADINKIDGASGQTPLMLAVAAHAPAIMQLLLQRGAEKTIWSRQRATALTMAVVDNRLTETRILLAANAPTAQPDGKTSLTPLDIAADRGYYEMTRLLIAAHARVAEAGSDGVTSLHLAAAREHIDIMELLVQAGAPVNAQTKSGLTPLLGAVSSRLPGSVAWLLEHGADPNLADLKGVTPLALATGLGDNTIIQALRAHGAK